MDGWIAVGHDSATWVKPIDWEEVYVVQMDPVTMMFECWKRSVTEGRATCLGRASTPRRAAELVPSSP